MVFEPQLDEKVLLAHITEKTITLKSKKSFLFIAGKEVW